MSNRDQVIAEIVKWHASLSTGARANLRRCHSVEDVWSVAEFHYLRSRILGLDEYVNRWLPVTVMILAHAKSNSDARLFVQLGQVRGGSRLYSEARFQRLLKQDTEELPRLLIPALRMLPDLSFNVADFVRSMMSHEKFRNRDWATQYYHVG